MQRRMRKHLVIWNVVKTLVVKDRQMANKAVYAIISLREIQAMLVFWNVDPTQIAQPIRFVLVTWNAGIPVFILLGVAKEHFAELTTLFLFASVQKILLVTQKLDALITYSKVTSNKLQLICI